MGDLQEIDGIGNTTEKKLTESGISSVNELANADLETLEDIGIRKADTILDRAQRQGVQVHSGVEVEQQQANAQYLTSGMEPVDAMLGGGLRGGFLIGVSGESKAGKTQFVLQMLTTAAEFYEGNVVYIETEPNRFQVSRLRTLIRQAERANVDDATIDYIIDQPDTTLSDTVSDVLQRIHKIEAYDPNSDTDNLRIQRNAYDAVRDTFDDVSLIVIDSFIANFRLSGQFTDRSDLPDRNTVIADHLEALQSLSDYYEAPILMTLQVQGNPDAYSGSNISIWGPVLMDHTITHLLHMEHGKGDLKNVALKGHPSQPDDEVTLQIPENKPIRSM